MWAWGEISRPYAHAVANWFTDSIGLYPTIALFLGVATLGIWSNMRD